MILNWIKNTYNQVLALASLKKKQKQFAWLFSAIFIGIAVFKYLKMDVIFTATLVLLIISGVLIIVSLLTPILIKYPLVVWLFIGKILGEITSTLILFVIYFFAFFPITFLKRIIKKETVKSGWIKRETHEVDYKKLY